MLTILQNVRNYLPIDMACHPRIYECSSAPLWGPQSFSHLLRFQGKKCPIFLQELFPGSKYKLVTENDVYKLIISNPKVEDTGKYTIEIAGISCTAYLDVEGKLVTGCVTSLEWRHYIHTSSAPFLFAVYD
jgi:hypothetical protein